VRRRGVGVGRGGSSEEAEGYYNAQSAGGAGQAGAGQQSIQGGSQTDTGGSAGGGSGVGGGVNPENANRFKRKRDQFGGFGGDDKEEDDYT